MGTGSGRSITGVDLGKAVRAAVEAGIAVKGGGHAMAAGVTLAKTDLEAFRSFLGERLAQQVDAARAGKSLLIDAALTAGGATPALFASLEQAGPFGAGNPEPVFVFPAHRLVDVAEVGQGHLRWRAKSGDGTSLEGILFRAAGEPLGEALKAAQGASLHFAGTLTLDRWNGRERVKLRLLDAAPAEARR